MQKRLGGGVSPDTGPLFRQGLPEHFAVIISERKEAREIYLPEANRLPLERPLSVPHRTLNAPQRRLCSELLRIRRGRAKGLQLA